VSGLGLLAARLVVAAGLSASAAAAAEGQRFLYAVNEAVADRGTISVYDIDAGHRLAKTIATVPDVADVRAVAASAATGKL
jgi:hypothetical protein